MLMQGSPLQQLFAPGNIFSATTTATGNGANDVPTALQQLLQPGNAMGGPVQCGGRLGGYSITVKNKFKELSTPDDQESEALEIKPSSKSMIVDVQALVRPISKKRGQTCSASPTPRRQKGQGDCR